MQASFCVGRLRAEARVDNAASLTRLRAEELRKDRRQCCMLYRFEVVLWTGRLIGGRTVLKETQTASRTQCCMACWC